MSSLDDFVLWFCNSPAEVQDLTSHCSKTSSLLEESDCMEGEREDYGALLLI